MVSRHARHEMTESAEKEFEEDFMEQQRKHPQNPHVKSSSLWTPHKAGK